MLAELTPDLRPSVPPQGLPPPAQTHLIPGVGEQGGAQGTHMEGRDITGCSASVGEARPAPEPWCSHLVLCKIFIHSPKRLRLQVLAGIPGQGLLWGHLWGPPPPGPAQPSCPPRPGRGARAGVRLCLDSVDHRDHPPPQGRSSSLQMYIHGGCTCRPAWWPAVHASAPACVAPGAPQGGGGMWAPSRS